MSKHIEFKYDIGDKVWILDTTGKRPKVRQVEVTGHFYKWVKSSSDDMQYFLSCGIAWQHEEDIFDSREGVLETL